MHIYRHCPTLHLPQRMVATCKSVAKKGGKDGKKKPSLLAPVTLLLEREAPNPAGCFPCTTPSWVFPLGRVLVLIWLILKEKRRCLVQLMASRLKGLNLSLSLQLAPIYCHLSTSCTSPASPNYCVHSLVASSGLLAAANGPARGGLRSPVGVLRPEAASSVPPAAGAPGGPRGVAAARPPAGSRARVVSGETEAEKRSVLHQPELGELLLHRGGRRPSA